MPDRDEPLCPRVSKLISETRTKLGHTQAFVADQAGISRERVVAIEGGKTLPTMKLCLKLAAALKIPRGQMIRALTTDMVADAEPAAVAEADAELGGLAFWNDVAHEHGIRIEHGQTIGEVNEKGDLHLTRRWMNCHATQEVSTLDFFDRITGEKLPSFAIKDEPRGVDYSHRVQTHGDTRLHRLTLEKPWTSSHPPFGFEFESHLPGAFPLAAIGLQHRESPDLVHEALGKFRTLVEHPFELLEFILRFPAGYEPIWEYLIGHFGTRPLDPNRDRLSEGRSCISFEFETDKNTACLKLVRPMPGFTFGIRWKPPKEWKP